MYSKSFNAPALDPVVWDIINGRQRRFKALVFRKRTRQVLLGVSTFGLGILLTLAFITPAENMVAPADMSMGASVLPLRPEKPEFSRLNLKAFIQEEGILCPNVVYAQAELESAFLSAGSSVKTNNLFGMRYPGQRPTTAIGIYLQGQDTIIYGTRAELRKYLKRPTYAVYAHWTDSVRDYKLWQDYSFRTREKYIEFLSRVYATAPHYAQRISEMVSGK